jgi:hypothetical protein
VPQNAIQLSGGFDVGQVDAGFIDLIQVTIKTGYFFIDIFSNFLGKVHFFHENIHFVFHILTSVFLGFELGDKFVRATVKQNTLFAPASRKAAAQASRVAPVVAISSTIRMD